MNNFYAMDLISVGVIILLSFASKIIHSQRTCILDRNECINDGRLGYCCSGQCLQIFGESKGFCKAEIENTISHSCISDGGRCKSNGDFCCSGNCYQLWKSANKSFGKCIPKANTTTEQEKCIEDNEVCHISGNLGYCCSGICFQRRGFEAGYCQNKSNAVCLDDEGECHRSGSMGFCCSGQCNQTIDKILGNCMKRNHTQNQNTNPSSTSGINYGIFGLLLVLAIIAPVIAIVMYRNRRPRNVLTEEDIKAFLEGEHRTEYLNLTVEKGLICDTADKIPYNKDYYEIDEKNFRIHRDEVLGEGAYGLVLGCTINDEKEIAAKTLHEGVETVYLKALLSELKVMIYLEVHVNIIGLVGAFTKNIKSGLIYVFYELCPLGSLEEYLRENRKGYVQDKELKDSSTIHNATYNNISENQLEFLDLLNWSYQLANGMNYLCQKRVIHGDLATRNVLLMNKNLIKITDFGLSRRLYEYSNYVKKQQEPLPWRWMAIESLRELKFSSQSDVWSFGVTLWEIYSMGDIPYGGLSWTIDFVSQLLNGLRLQKPVHATNEIYAVLTQCFKCNEMERPSFDVLKTTLLDILNNQPGYTFSSTLFTFN